MKPRRIQNKTREKEKETKNDISKRNVWKNGPGEGPCALSPGRTLGRPSAASPSVQGSLSLSHARDLALRRLVFRSPLALRRLVGRRRRRRPTPGAEAFVSIFAGDEHPLGIPIPCLPFLLCEADHSNPNLKLFGYLIDASKLQTFWKNYRV